MTMNGKKRVGVGVIAVAGLVATLFATLQVDARSGLNWIPRPAWLSELLALEKKVDDGFEDTEKVLDNIAEKFVTLAGSIQKNDIELLQIRVDGAQRQFWAWKDRYEKTGDPDDRKEMRDAQIVLERKKRELQEAK